MRSRWNQKARNSNTDRKGPARAFAANASEARHSHTKENMGEYRRASRPWKRCGRGFLAKRDEKWASCRVSPRARQNIRVDGVLSDCSKKAINCGALPRYANRPRCETNPAPPSPRLQLPAYANILKPSSIAELEPSERVRAGAYLLYALPTYW